MGCDLSCMNYQELEGKTIDSIQVITKPMFLTSDLHYCHIDGKVKIFLKNSDNVICHISYRYDDEFIKDENDRIILHQNVKNLYIKNIEKLDDPKCSIFNLFLSDVSCYKIIDKNDKICYIYMRDLYRE